MALKQNLISYWALNEASGNAIDSHGSNTLSGVGSPGSAAGKVGNCRTFSPGASFSIPDNASISAGDIDFTVAFWVKSDSSATATFVNKESGTPPGREYSIDNGNTGTAYRFYVFDPSHTFASVEATSHGAPAIGVWEYVVAWHDSVANTLNIQINNGTVDSVSHTTGVNNNASAFQLGLRNAIRQHVGGLDEVAFWNRVLTSGERTELYNSGAGKPYDTFDQPLNLTAPVLSTSGQVTSGTWDAQNNGPITLTTYLRLSSDDSLVATLFTADPDFSSYVTEGESYYVVERASNNGGYDDAEDTQSNHTVANRSFNSLVNSDAARLSRFASLSGGDILDSWGASTAQWYKSPTDPATAWEYKPGPPGVPGAAFYFGSPNWSNTLRIDSVAPDSYGASGTMACWLRDTSGYESSYAIGRFSQVPSRSITTELGGGKIKAGIDGVEITSTTLTDQQWRHAVFTWARGTCKLYVDGVLEGTIGRATNAVAKSGFGWIGSDNGYNRWRGEIADFQFYNRALSATEVLELYNRPEPLNISAPVLSTSGLVTSGTWDDRGNGTIARTTHLHLASDDSLVATLYTVDPDFSSYVNQETTYYVVERAENDGGFDVAEDTRSNTATIGVKTWKLMSGETSATLTIPNVQAGDYGRQFRCVATNAAGSVTSDSAEIVAP